MPKIEFDYAKNNDTDKAKIIIISGATASGKSDLALNLALKHNGAIINADALQIYGDLPILSAQPNQESQTQIDHYLYGIFSAYQKVSVGIWLSLVEEVIDKILRSKKIPIIVGGSGMYISCLIKGIAKIPIISQEIHAQTLTLYEKIGHTEFIKKFGNEKIIDRQKLLRRAEVFLQTGQNIEDFHLQEKQKILKNFRYIHLNLNPSREKIYQNCNVRFEKMLERGVIEEVKSFIKNRQDFYKLPITKTLGFQEIERFLSNDLSQLEMIKLATQKTRNYAKRQLTWFRHQFEEIIFCQQNEDLNKKFITFLKS